MSITPPGVEDQPIQPSHHSPATEPASTAPTDWRTIVALNAVSAVAQLGQFGIGFVVLPLWLAQQGKTPSYVGAFGTAQWSGMALGMVLVPVLLRRWQARTLVVAGLLCSVLAMLLMLITPIDNRISELLWCSLSALTGLGLGLRWIALEPWLYSIAPIHGRGRLVGVHEMLVSLAPIVAPALTLWLGLDGGVPFMLAIGFNALALLPLAMARVAKKAALQELASLAESGQASSAKPIHQECASEHRAVADQARRHLAPILFLGFATALLGGSMEGAFSSLFPLFGVGRGIGAAQLAWLLTLFGIGGMVLQYGIGWLADHKGLALTCAVCATGTLVLAGAIAWPALSPGLPVLVFLFGAMVSSPLTLAIIAGASSPQAQITRNVSRLSLAYTVSAAVGPLPAAWLMERLGSEALMLWVIVLALAWCIALGWQHYQPKSRA